MTRADNFRLVAVGGLADVIDQVRQWHRGVRVLSDDPAPQLWSEDEAWDALIHSRDEMHHGNQRCHCFRCRPNRRYK